MKHMKKMFGIIGLTVLLAVPALAQFGGRMQGRNMRSPRMQNGIVMMLKARQAELKLTDKQLDDIQNLVDAHRKAALDMQKEAALRRIEMQKQFLERDEMDLALYQKSLEKAAALRINGQVARLRLRQDINQLLTEEQREALKRNMDKPRSSRGRDGRFTRGRTSRGFGRRMPMNQDRGRNPKMRNRIIR